MIYRIILNYTENLQWIWDVKWMKKKYFKSFFLHIVGCSFDGNNGIAISIET